MSLDIHGGILAGGRGTYAYNAQGTPCTVGGGGPYAVCGITGTVNGFTNPTFTYDLNGNMTAGMGRTIAYTSYNMPSQVVGVGYSGGASTTYNYVYNAEHERTKLIHSTLGTFIYLHPAGKGQLLYEKETAPGGTPRVEHKYYISAGGVAVAVHYARENPNITETATATRYLHQDHLGSITLITNEAGAEAERLAYEPFGKRRYPAGTDDATNGLFGQVTDRGFTDHEHLDEIALIHMNGRVYDPVIARFMTPDPIVDQIHNLQDHNRYSYVNNNPLMYTDPSGYLKLGKIFRAAVAIAALIYAPEIYAAAGSWGAATFGSAAIGQGIVGGSLIGYVTTGSLQGTVTGGLSGALFGGIGDLGLVGAEKILAHAAGGCAMGVMTGGDCGSGALAAGASAALGPAFSDLGRVGEGVARAVVGGTFSVLGGGKFANGALTSAYAYMFNDLGANHEAGKAAEARAIAQLRDEGRVVAEQVRLRIMTAAGGSIDAIADYAFRDDKGRLVFGEVKDGTGARLSQNQKAVYAALVEGRAIITNPGVREALGVTPGVRYTVALTVNAVAGSRALGQVARMLGSRPVVGALSILGSAPVMAADLFLHSSETARNADCVGCLNAGR